MQRVNPLEWARLERYFLPQATKEKVQSRAEPSLANLVRAALRTGEAADIFREQ